MWTNCGANIFVVMCPKNGFTTESGRCGLLYYLSDIDYDHHRGPNSNDRDHLVRGLTTDTKDIQNSVFVVAFCPIIDFFSLIAMIAKNCKNCKKHFLQYFVLIFCGPTDRSSPPTKLSTAKDTLQLLLFSIFTTKISGQDYFHKWLFCVFLQQRYLDMGIFFSWY